MIKLIYSSKREELLKWRRSAAKLLQLAFVHSLTDQYGFNVVKYSVWFGVWSKVCLGILSDSLAH